MPTQSPLRSLVAPTPGLLGALVILSCTLAAAGCMGSLEAGPISAQAEDEVTWNDGVPTARVLRRQRRLLHRR